MSVNKIEIGSWQETGCGASFTRTACDVVFSTPAGPVVSIRRIRPQRLIPQLRNLGLSLDEMKTLFDDKIVTGSWEV